MNDFYCETTESEEPPCAGLVALRAQLAAAIKMQENAWNLGMASGRRDIERELAEARAEIAALKEDAERYRLLRDIAYQGSLESCPDEAVHISESDFNARYDAAIAAKGGL